MVAPAYPKTLHDGGGQHCAPPFAKSRSCRENEYGLEGVRKGEDCKHNTVGRIKSERCIRKVL